MDLIHSHDDSKVELVIYLDAHHDLSVAGDLLNTADPDLSDEEYGRREMENILRAESLDASLRVELARIARERELTVYVECGDQAVLTHTPIMGEDPDTGEEYEVDTLEHVVWQEAQDCAGFTRSYVPEGASS